MDGPPMWPQPLVRNQAQAALRRPETWMLGLAALLLLLMASVSYTHWTHARHVHRQAAQTDALLDAVARLQPGVLNDQRSHEMDSFHPALDGLLDCPHYTRPEEWRGVGVPPVLLSGHHANIERWRRNEQLRISAAKRPDLGPEFREWLGEFVRGAQG